MKAVAPVVAQAVDGREAFESLALPAGQTRVGAKPDAAVSVRLNRFYIPVRQAISGGVTRNAVAVPARNPGGCADPYLARLVFRNGFGYVVSKTVGLGK